MPYKGFFDKNKAMEAAESFSKEEYDVYIRGVTAYSTLGWFNDPVLSSMLKYRDSDFVVMIFHELFHSVLFFKDHVDFNERFAEFLGREAAVLFYTDKEGPESETVKRMRQEWEDALIFSSFMTEEYKNLAQWYRDNKGNIDQDIKRERLRDIQDRFLIEIYPELKISRYDYFPEMELNNARLLSYRSYNYNMEEFEKLFSSDLISRNIKTFINYCSDFKKEKDPELALTQIVEQL